MGQALSDALNRALGLPKQDGYVCEHGAPCKPGGFTDCEACPKDPRQVKYRPHYPTEPTP